MEEHELIKIAAQLRKPSGEDGVLTGLKMFENNGSMIRRAIDLAGCKEGDRVLEMGYGNGAHLEYLFGKAENLQYIGIDISETMQQEAAARNKKKVEEGTAHFLLTNGIDIPLQDGEVDAFFTVNTIYFWEDHAAVLKEIRRVLKPGGSVCIALASRRFMEQLPFTRYGFRMFHPEEVEALLKQAELTVYQIMVETEEVPGILQNIKEREIVLALARKQL